MQKLVFIKVLIVLLTVTIVVGVFIVGQHYAAIKKAEERAKSTQTKHRGKCPNVVYVKFNDFVLKMPKATRPENAVKKRISFDCYDNSPDNPVVADGLSGYNNYIELEGWHRPLNFQFFFGSRRDWLGEVEYDLAERGQTIEDLPRQGNFYVYQKVMGKTVFSPYHLGAIESLTGSDGKPVVLVHCIHEPERSACGCTPSFKWKGIRMSARFTWSDLCEERPMKLETWETLYPLIVNYLDNLVVSSDREEKEIE